MTKENIHNLETYYKLIEEINEIKDWFLLRPLPTPSNRFPINKEDIKLLADKIISFYKISRQIYIYFNFLRISKVNNFISLV